MPLLLWAWHIRCTPQEAINEPERNMAWQNEVLPQNRIKNIKGLSGHKRADGIYCVLFLKSTQYLSKKSKNKVFYTFLK